MIRVRIRPTPHTMKTDQQPQRLPVRMLAGRRAWPVWWSERGDQNPIPSRTRPLTAPAPMVLCLKTRESRSPPDLPSTYTFPRHDPNHEARPAHARRALSCSGPSMQVSLRPVRSLGSSSSPLLEQCRRPPIGCRSRSPGGTGFTAGAVRHAGNARSAPGSAGEVGCPVVSPPPGVRSRSGAARRRDG